MQTIEITDGKVCLIEKNVVKNISIKQFKQSLLSTMGFRTPVLPPHTVLYARAGDMQVYVIEQSPCKRTIKYKERGKGQVQREHTIPLPFVYFLMEFNGYALEDTRIFFAQRKIDDENEHLCYPPLPNLYDDCRICMGDMRFNVTASIPSKITHATEFYWGSLFNNDLATLYAGKMPRGIKQRSTNGDYFTGWEKVTEEEVCSLEWVPYKTLDEVMDEELGGKEDDDE